MESKYESEFIQLVMGLQGSAWMMLGKIANPMTGKPERNLDAARAVIDTLLMLKEKTKGNLSKAEESVLNSAITQLELNYIDEVNRTEPEEKADIPQAEKAKPDEEPAKEPKKEKPAKKGGKIGKKNSGI